MQPIIHYFSRLRQFVKLNADKRQAYLQRPNRDFTRSSPLTFRRTVSFVLDLARQTLAVELARFFNWQPDEIVTKSALCQRRKAIAANFFRDLFDHTASLFYHCFPEHKRWRGKRLFAVDGTGQRLPYETALGQAFGTHMNQHGARPSMRLLLTHDVLNNVLYRVDFYNQNSSEIYTAYPNVEQLPRDGVYIYDRHYASFGLAYLHDRHGSDYVIRMPLDQSNVVKKFAESTDNERIITLKLGVGRAYRSLKTLGLNPVLHTEFKARLLRVELDDGQVEVVMTSLTDRFKYPQTEFKWLYGKRWGVETTIYVLKSFLQLALVSARTLPGVAQDLWATFAFYNQQSALIAACEDEVKRKTGHRRYQYKINRNVTAGHLKEFLLSIYLDGPARWRSRTKVLLELMPRYTEPYRPDRDRERERKIMRANDRHIHEKNYRKSM